MASDCFFITQSINGAADFRNIRFNHHWKIWHTFVIRQFIHFYGRCSAASNHCYIQVNRSKRTKISVDRVIGRLCTKPFNNGLIHAPEKSWWWGVSNISTVSVDTDFVHGIRYIYVVNWNHSTDIHLHGRKFFNQNETVWHDFWKYYAKYIHISTVQNVSVGGTNDRLASMYNDILYKLHAWHNLCGCICWRNQRKGIELNE